MKKFRLLSTGALAAGLMLSATAFAQETPAPITTSTSAAQASSGQTWTNEQLITATVHDAWILSGKNEATFFDMVTQLATLSASKRGLTLPETTEAGRQFGEMIKKFAKADTDQLLYAVVDKAVLKVGVAPKA
jgi:hypothetical protein